MLENIKSDKDLKKLSIDEKYGLCSELRNYILDVVSKNGGHLSSNLGVIELTVALESVFDLSKDKVIFDVGHQCYAHKIINGRKDAFKTLRCHNGIAGFPKYQESLTDTFNTGHSSTSISAAMGFAKSRDIKGEHNSVIAIIGDGALTGGMALEALNHVGSTNTNMIVILNDNEMSISKNVGGINEFLTKLRSRKSYRKSNDKWKKIIGSIPLVGIVLVKIVSKLKEAVKSAIIPKMYFEDIGFTYLGPIDGHNIEDMEAIFEKTKEMDGPILIHVLTKKGKGYKFAEETPDKFHSISSFDINTGKTINKKKKDYSSVFGNKLVSLAHENKNIVAVTAAMKDGTGLSLFKEKYEDRFFDVGIAEQHALTFAAGLAHDGMIPFVPIYSSFYQRGYDQVIHDICMQNLHVIMCVDRAGCVGNDGETHQGLYDLSFFKLIPNIVIMCPKNFSELESMMEFACTLNKPIVIRYPRGSESNIKFKNNKIKLGSGEKIKSGDDLSIITIGNMVSRGYEVSEKIKEIGISSELINVRFLKPLDTKLISKSINKTKNVIVIEDSTSIGGLGSSIKELLIDENISDVKFKSFSYPDKFIEHGNVSELESIYNLDVDSIVDYIKSNK